MNNEETTIIEAIVDMVKAIGSGSRVSQKWAQSTKAVIEALRNADFSKLSEDFMKKAVVLMYTIFGEDDEDLMELAMFLSFIDSARSMEKHYAALNTLWGSEVIRSDSLDHC